MFIIQSFPLQCTQCSRLQHTNERHMRCEPNTCLSSCSLSCIQRDSQTRNVGRESNASTAYRDFSHKNRFWMRPTQSCSNFLPYRLQPSPWRRRRYPQSQAPFQIGTKSAEWSETGILRWSMNVWSTRLAGRTLWRSSTKANAEGRWDVKALWYCQ